MKKTKGKKKAGKKVETPMDKKPYASTGTRAAYRNKYC